MLDVRKLRILVISDSHGMVRTMKTAINKSNPNVIIFLGDGLRNILDLQNIYYDKKFYFVKGNCDFLNYKINDLLDIAGKKVFITHGHLYNVKRTYETLIDVAREHNADVALFGHTHIPYQNYIDGLYLLNPGSIGSPTKGKISYGIVDIENNNIVTNIVYL